MYWHHYVSNYATIKTIYAKMAKICIYFQNSFSQTWCSQQFTLTNRFAPPTILSSCHLYSVRMREPIEKTRSTFLIKSVFQPKQNPVSVIHDQFHAWFNNRTTTKYLGGFIFFNKLNCLSDNESAHWFS